MDGKVENKKPKEMVLLVSGSFPQELFETMRKFSKRASTFFSEVNFENLVNNGFTIFKKNGDITDVLSLSTPFSGWWPKYSRKTRIPAFPPIGNYRFSGYCNVFGIVVKSKSYHKKVQIKKEIRQLKPSPCDRLHVVLLEMTSYNIEAALYAKKIFHNTDVSVFIPDVPEYMTNGKRGIVYRILKKIDNRRIYSLSKTIDYFFPFSSSIISFCNLVPEKCLVIEGITNPTIIAQSCNGNDKRLDKKIVLFSGTLSEAYNLSLLLKAIPLIKENNVEFRIIGDGDMLAAFEELAQVDSRVKVFGSIGHDRVIEEQKMASVFVNPRLNNETFSKLSFPSKILEYLSNCKPTVSFIPQPFAEEYKNLFITPESGTSECLAVAITKALTLTIEDSQKLAFEMKKKAIEKNPKNTIKRIISFWHRTGTLDTK